MDIAGYLDQVKALYDSGQATEHSYRPALYALFQSIDPAIQVVNEPKKSDGGMPDFLFHRDGVPFGWAEAKDIDKDVIRLKGYSVEQRKRYEAAYPNLIYTNGVDFEFIREGVSVHFTSIADFLMGLQPQPDKFAELERQLTLFAEQKPVSIRSAAKLAEFMAAKAAIIKDEVGIALSEDPDFRSGLGGQFKSFQQNLLPNLTPGEFSDIYAETITYGMFAARFHDTDLDTFSRQEAMERLPASNPFLKGLFEYIAGPSLPPRLKYIVDDLVEVMRASDPHSLFRDFGKFTARNDPFIHFYEDFLAAYNPKKRKSRGVWYTPEPVVDFIVRAVDDVLKSEFGLADGLADTSKVTVDWDTGTNDPKTGKAVTIKKDVHKVQILDPATGTGTFLAKAVQLISDRVKARAPGMWSSYVENDLLPRLHGFELLMASYAMCHMKLDMQLTESGYTPSANPPRLSVWLTNALEPAEREVRDLFFQPLAEEARGASEVKRQTPIMCVIGNPPYSGESSNKGDHIMNLMEAYKMEPGGKERLKERNPKWINDDYVKFIRSAEDLIAKNPSGGVLGFITNHGYLDNPTFRGMRWHLLKTFDKIWVLDLHGNAKKKEVSPDGSPDKNVFDIQQGVALIIAVRKGAGSKELAQVWHGDLWGSRKAKSDKLGSTLPVNSSETAIRHDERNFPFEPRDYELENMYRLGFSIAKLQAVNSVGIVTARDALTVNIERADLWSRVQDFFRSEPEELRRRYSLGDDAQDWSVQGAKNDVVANFDDRYLVPILYRPLDSRWTYFTGNSRGFHCRPRTEVMRHQLKPNLSLMTCRQIIQPTWHHALAAGNIIDDSCVSNLSRERGYSFPLYLYPDENAVQADALAPTGRTLNLDPKLYAKICDMAGIDPADTDMARQHALSLEGEGGARSAEGVGVRRSGGVEPPPPTPPHGEGSRASFRAATGDARPSEVKVFDYIYGVLHSPDYRETFAEFLKIDFPRVPYPPSPEVFRHVSEKGEQLRRLHLMEAPAIGETPYPFLGEGDGEVAAKHPRFEPQASGTPDQVRGDEEGDVRAQTNPVTPAPEPGSRSAAGRVYINGKGSEGQYFDNVPQVAWDFYIGGYQPAQKWLKDRKGRTLSYEDVGHYQKIVKILVETDRIMREIELPLDADGT
ncbi:MAG: DNA methyltransferase [Sphingomonadaceae bacterium]|nr:DNA methyltransferase [Sphingomonadaceae bacterium]